MVRKSRSKPYHWSQDVHHYFHEIGIRQVAYVPDGGLARLIDLCNADRSMRSVVLTTEEEGVAQMAGAWLGGQRGIFLTQSGGVGNCINMLSIIQVPMGQGTVAALEAGGVLVQHVDSAQRVAETVIAASKLAFDANRAVAVVISQRITGTGAHG